MTARAKDCTYGSDNCKFNHYFQKHLERPDSCKRPDCPTLDEAETRKHISQFCHTKTQTALQDEKRHAQPHGASRGRGRSEAPRGAGTHRRGRGREARNGTRKCQAPCRSVTTVRTGEGVTTKESWRACEAMFVPPTVDIAICKTCAKRAHEAYLAAERSPSPEIDQASEIVFGEEEAEMPLKET